MTERITTEDALERHIDLAAGIGALAWSVAALFLPELATLMSPAIAGPFALGALTRWYRKRSKFRKLVKRAQGSTTT